ncbi:MAG: glycoside hydrolase family 15 protein [Bdellovibrionaceae bacterium]|nr:glycoside hydrolase family 15 protein [Pseudobdellovibrionaceae bacterium]
MSLKKYLYSFITILNFQEIHSEHYLLSNLKDNSGREGVVIASPSRSNPNYYYHWVRDAGLVVREYVEEYKYTSDLSLKRDIRRFVQKWIQVEIEHQRTAGESWANLGEPIFTVDGRIYPHPWGRPQSDGPAIRALTMTEWALLMIQEGREEDARKLYGGKIPAEGPIKKDLEYVAHHWFESNFDLWEEVKGVHFFTLMAQRIALVKGADLAAYMGDHGASDYYLRQADRIKSVLNSFYSAEKAHLIPTINQVDGWKNKVSELDTASILAINYFSFDDVYSVDSLAAQNTAAQIVDVFRNLYKINSDKPNLAPMIGRYSEDVYDGNGFSGGNPWYLTTHAMAEYLCRRDLSKERTSPNLKKIPFSGWQFLERSASLADSKGHFSEQADRVTGEPRGAADLTWSYASYLRAIRVCKRAGVPLGTN